MGALVPGSTNGGAKKEGRQIKRDCKMQLCFLLHVTSHVNKAELAIIIPHIGYNPDIF